MQHSSYLVAPLFGLVASSAIIPSIAPRADQSLFSAISMSGIDLTQDEKPCGPNQTVLTCAQNIAKTWQIPVSAQGEAQPMKLPIAMPNLYVQPMVYIEASECSLDSPVLSAMGDTVSCSVQSCSESFSFATTNTITDTYGFTTSLTLTEAAEVDIPLTAKFTTTISTTETASWTDTTTVTNTTTVTKTWTLANGEICSPTTIQYKVKCLTKIKLAEEATEWQVYSSGFPMGQTMWSCDKNANVRSGLHMQPGEFDQFCQALKSDGQVATIDIGMYGGNTDRAWSMDGCMWPVMPQTY